MINKYKYLLVALVTFLMVGISCTDLDETLYDQMVEETYVPQESDIWRIIGGAYTPLAFPIFMGWHGYFDASEECTDQMVVNGRPGGAWIDGGVYRKMHQHKWTPKEPGHVSATWGNIFEEGVFKTNYAIVQADSVLPIGRGKSPEVQRAMRDSIISELKVLRAFYYWMLCDMYGSAPIVTDYRDESLPAYKSRKEVYNFIVSEVQNNMPLLSRKGKEMYGRFNVWSAHALLARTYLNAQVYIGEDRLDSCIMHCDSIINSGLYQLDANYRTPFCTENDQQSKELIYAIPQGNDYGKMIQGWFYLPFKSLHKANQKTYESVGDGPWDAGGQCALPQWINTYDKNDVRYDATWIKGQQYAKDGSILYCSTDPKNSGKPLVFVNELQDIDLSEEYAGFRCGKYEIAVGFKEQLANDFPVFRYTEILMNKAECLLRKGDANGAAALVTEVRKRCFTDIADATVTGDTLLKGSRYNYGSTFDGQPTPGGGSDIQYGRFLDELGWEFAIEAQRRTQLIRFGVFSSKGWYNHEADVDNHTSVFPIPQTIINGNPNLKQNDGY